MVYIMELVFPLLMVADLIMLYRLQPVSRGLPAMRVVIGEVICRALCFHYLTACSASTLPSVSVKMA